eukprot:5675484-Pyramimonas_sp.AAC.1
MGRWRWQGCAMRTRLAEAPPRKGPAASPALGVLLGVGPLGRATVGCGCPSLLSPHSQKR